ncbi:MAG: gluconokinase [Galactobacter sp.]
MPDAAVRRDAPTPTVLVVMGVSGSGKSTLAGCLADRLGCDLAEGDDFHPADNIAKMSQGIPLTDADREPWLLKVSAWIDQQLGRGRTGVITCSALKRRYRDLLRHDRVIFVHATGPHEVIAQRLRSRTGHFMPETLLASQYADLEELGTDEAGIEVDVRLSPEDQARCVIAQLG